MTANQSGIRDNHRFGKVGDFLKEKYNPMHSYVLYQPILVFLDLRH